MLSKLGTSTARMARRAALALAILSGMMALAHAHASLVATNPADGAVIAAAPSILSLTFSEPVSPIVLSLLAPDGTPRSLDRYVLRDRTLEITPPPDMVEGTHVLSWRVTSEDGHPIAGSVVFSIGAPSATAPQTSEAVDWFVRAGLWTGKVALYIGLFLGVGGVFAIAWLVRAGVPGRPVVAAALFIGGLGAIVSTGFQGLDALGGPATAIGDARIWPAAMATSFGRTILVAILAFVLAALALRPATTATRVLSLAALLLAALALSLSGHASAAAPQWLMRPAVFLHAAAIAFWAGALMPLGLALRHGDPGALPALRRFSAAIPAVVIVLLVAGLMLAIVQVGRPAALVETAYGQVLVVKLGLLGILFAIAAVNRWRLTGPTEQGDRVAAGRLVRAIAAETLVVVLVFGVASVWRFTPPPRALAAAIAPPAALHIHTAKAMAEVIITPGRAGVVDVSAALMAGEFGPLAAKELTLVFANPAKGIEPIRRPAAPSGDGAWKLDGLVLPVAGTWTVRLDILISDFEMTRLSGDVEIRP